MANTDFSVDLSMQPVVTPFFDKASNTISYVVLDSDTSACAVIDPVTDFDYASGRMNHQSADEIIAYIKKQNLNLEWLIETHVHADHLSGAAYIKDKIGGTIGIGGNITDIQVTFADVFKDSDAFRRDGSQFDHLFDDNEQYKIGNINCVAISTPGHTPACMTHVIGNACFVGDTLFMPDGGSARADFPGGNAGQLYDSIQKIFSLPDDLRLYMCHDYGPNGRDIAWETTVGEQRATNIHVGNNTSRETFVALREERDATLAMPRLILPALQVNIRAGQVPKDESGNLMLKVPVNAI